MARAAEFENEVEALCSRLDAISTSHLVAGKGGVEPDTLISFAVAAEDAGFLDTARIAKSLAKKMGGKRRNDAESDRLLCKGLSELQASLEQRPATEAKPNAANGPGTGETPRPNNSPVIAEDPELIADFLVESREHLSSIESQMLELERDPESAEVLNAVFRTFHTIKGLAGFLEFTVILDLAHDVETLLDLARKGKVKISSPFVDVVLESADYLKCELNRIEGQVAPGISGPPADHRKLSDRISILSLPEDQQQAPPSNVVAAPPAQPARNVQEASDSKPESEPCAPELEPRDLPVIEGARATPPASADQAKSPESSSVRVETAKLDHLLEMVGEMVIAQSLIRNNPVLAGAVDERLLADMAQLIRNTADIQRTTMSMRMVPIGQLFQRSARLIRDLSRKANKQIVLETSGEDTEIDKTIAEELSDPLLHMVRNSIDHGIEAPDMRAAAGKPAVARILLKAYHQAGQIVIEISDDGKGLNREKILAKAVRSGLVEAGAHLSDGEVYQLIFEPGFSTAEKVTDVSGRGVGMDVVRQNVQKLRGRIEIRSVPGEGTTFVLRLPLTLAIIDGLVVAVGTSRYVVPVFAVREMLKPTAEMLSTVHGREEMALVRDSLLPIVRLHRRFGITPKATDLVCGLLVVVERGEKRFCLFVDDLVGKQEIVIKSLGEMFKDVSGLAGCAVLGDGSVGLILDMEGVYRGGAQ